MKKIKRPVTLRALTVFARRIAGNSEVAIEVDNGAWLSSEKNYFGIRRDELLKERKLILAGMLKNNRDFHRELIDAAGAFLGDDKPSDGLRRRMVAAFNESRGSVERADRATACFMEAKAIDEKLLRSRVKAIRPMDFKNSKGEQVKMTMAIGDSLDEVAEKFESGNFNN